MIIHDELLIAFGDESVKFDSGEGASEAAAASEEGSRRTHFPILTEGGIDTQKNETGECLKSCGQTPRTLSATQRSRSPETSELS